MKFLKQYMIDIKKLKPGDIIYSEPGDQEWRVEKITDEGNLYCSTEIKVRKHFTFYPFEFDLLTLVRESPNNKTD